MILDYANEPKEDIRERKIPVLLIVLSATVVMGKKLIIGELIDAVSAFGWLFIFVIIAVPLSAIACVLTTKTLGAKFGDTRSAILKLSAIFLVQIAIGSLLPPTWSRGTEVLSSFIYFSLLLWLFDLEFVAGALFTVILVLIRLGIIHLPLNIPLV